MSWRRRSQARRFSRTLYSSRLGGAIERNSAAYPSSSSSLARRRSRSITTDLVEVRAIDRTEELEVPDRAEGERVQGVFVPREEDLSLAEDAALQGERQVLKHHEIDVGFRQVLEPRPRRREACGDLGREDEAQVEVGLRGRVASSAAAEKDQSEDMRVTPRPLHELHKVGWGHDGHEGMIRGSPSLDHTLGGSTGE